MTLTQFRLQLKNYTVIKSYLAYRKIASVHKRSIHVVGHARGGSTALAELVAKSIESPIVWEPFFKGRKPFRKHNHKKLWGWNEAILPDATESTIDHFFEEINNGKFLHPRFFTGQKIRPILHSKNMVIKYCYVHHMLPYLVNKFNFKPIVLKRHPGQIMASRIRYGGFVKDHIEYPTGTEQSKNSKHHFNFLADRRNDFIRSNIGMQTWNYCLACKSIERIAKEKMLLIQFDDLILNPEQVCHNLSQFIQLSVNVQFAKESSRTTKGQPSAGDRMHGWKKKLPTELISEMDKICNEAFQLNIPF